MTLRFDFKTKLLLLVERLRSSYWFVPTIILLLGAVSAIALVELDRQKQSELAKFLPWVFSGGAEGARSILLAVAGSIITVTATTFSITIAVLSFTSAQFGPRLLRGFVQDTSNQVVLGIFLGTFLYSILVLRAVESIGISPFVPQLAVTGAVLLAITSIAMLIYFLHHVAISIQVSRIIEKVSIELQQSIDRIFPDHVGLNGQVEPGQTNLEIAGQQTATSRSKQSGYLLSVDSTELFSLATQHGLSLEIARKPGDFVPVGGVLCSIYGQNLPNERVADEIAGAFVFGAERTPAQDLDFLLLQLVEIAVRALSPGVNDPFTAIMCLHRLGAAVMILGEREFPSTSRRSPDGAAQISAPAPDFKAFVELAFREIHHHGKSDPLVMKCLRQILEDLESSIKPQNRRESIRLERLSYFGEAVGVRGDLADSWV